LSNYGRKKLYNIDVQIENVTFQVICSILYVAVFFVGTFGNILVVQVILTNKTMRNPTNLFITNLAFADILVTALSNVVNRGRLVFH
jgi:hypothetical protein